MDAVNTGPHWVFHFPWAARKPTIKWGSPLAGEGIVIIGTFILISGSILYHFPPFFHPHTSFLGQGLLGFPTPPFSFSYDFVSMSPNHLAPRMVVLPFCLLSPPDTGSLRSFVQEKGQGLGWGRGRHWRCVDVSWATHAGIYTP